ncbi:MAG TPA: NHL repeat-containing protein [Opitutaceae bacterium]
MLPATLAAQESASWTVSTIAGVAGQNGSADGIGAAAQFNGPRGIAIDASGTLYVADTFNHTIRKIAADGTVTTWAGAVGQSGSADGTGANARFNYPAGLTVDSSGNVYVADSLNNTIRKITSSGAVSTLAGSAVGSGFADGSGSSASFYQPVGVAVDASGNVYVADSGNSALRKITPGGVVTTVQVAAGSPQFNNPYGVAVDGSGILYVADTFANAIRTVSTSGAVTTLAGSSKGTSGSADGTGGAAQFSGPSAITINSSGTLYVTESGNSIVRSISNGVVTTIAGTPSGTGSIDSTGNYSYFDAPQGVAVASDGSVYVCDTLNSTIRKLVRGQVVVTPPPLPAPTDASVRFINISTRSYVGTGGNILIGGFIIGGTTSKTVLIRANGPALIAQGLAAANVLADPVLTVFQGSGVIATNDNWGDDPANAAAVAQANQTYSTNWPTNSKDSALVLTLPPGGYTAQVTGKNNTTGIALIEVFELTSDGGSRLVNISTRSRVQTGAGVQIAGFIITGSSPKNVLIRAGGPFLSALLPNPNAALSDPVLQLYQGSTVIATNDDWSSDPTHASLAQQAFTAAGAVPYAMGSKDAVLVMTLAPGGYTAIVSGKAGAQGIALIEVDELP